MARTTPILLALAAAILLIVAQPALAIPIGTVDGYVKNTTGATVYNASVTVFVNGCVSGSCSRSVFSQTNGYYVTSNLELPAYGTVTVFATKNGASGSATGTANQFYVAHVNVTICRPPSAPALTPEPDTHTTSATLQWASGTDPEGQTVHDELQIDGGTIATATSPNTTSGLSYSSHTWQVRTCNSLCCSGWSSDTFIVTNNPPSAPKLDVYSYVNTPSVDLAWTSGTDPDGDSTYDQFQFNSLPVVNNSASPQTVTGYADPSYNTWQARTCDYIGACSAWNSSSFIVGLATCPTPPPTCLVPTPQVSPVPTVQVVQYCPYGVPTPQALPCLVAYPPEGTPKPIPTVAPTPAVTVAPTTIEKSLSARIIESGKGYVKILAVDGRGFSLPGATVIVFLSNGTMLSEQSDAYGISMFNTAGTVSSIVVTKKGYNLEAIAIPPAPCEVPVPGVGPVSCELAILAATSLLSFLILIGLAGRTRRKEFGYKYAWAVHRKGWPWQHVTVSKENFSILLAATASLAALSALGAARAAGAATATGAFTASPGSAAAGVVAVVVIIGVALAATGRVFKRKD